MYAGQTFGSFRQSEPGSSAMDRPSLIWLICGCSGTTLKLDVCEGPAKLRRGHELIDGP